MKPITRRKLLGRGAQAIAAGGALTVLPTVKTHVFAKESTAGTDYYRKLGVTPFINAAGTYTVLSASTMPDEVQAAIALAAKKPVNLNELLEASGAYLAKQLHCEAALVTSGAAAALVLGTAACVTKGNDQAILGIPTDMADVKNEVIVQKSHRYGYDHALRNCGIRFVEVETLEQYEQAFNDRTVMAHYFNAGVGTISREDWVRVARQHGTPLLQRCRSGCSTHFKLVEIHADGIRSGDVLGRQGIEGTAMQRSAARPERSDRSGKEEQFAEFEHHRARYENRQRRNHRPGSCRRLVFEAG